MTNPVHPPTLASPRRARHEVRRPITTLLVPTITITLATQIISLHAGWNVMPAKVLELVLLLGGATFLTARIGGRPAVRGLYSSRSRSRSRPEPSTPRPTAGSPWP